MKRLRNLRKIPAGTILGVLVAVYVAFYLVQTVQHNYQLQKQITGQKQQIANLQSANQTLQYQIDYYNTDDYKEKEARAKLGLQAPGEGVVILPGSGNEDDSVLPTPPKAKAAPKASDWQQWIDFLEGKPTQ
ncbi:MAG TPA: septum formation initiator family protein [Candidatus Saccharimonadales bacterium]|nr:septum formation initiator family protein [Candidatus Saccharimonadales bacterium]